MNDWSAYVRQHIGPLRIAPEREHEIIGELAQQLEQAYLDARADGVSETEAIGRAESQIPDWQRLAREIETAERPQPAFEPPRRDSPWSGIDQDVRHAFRFLRGNPVLSTIAITMLAFGIGANTAIFTIVDAIALRNLPYAHPQRLMSIETRKENQPELEPWSSAPDFFDIRRQTHAFNKVAGVSPVWNVVMTGHGPAQNFEALFVSADFFPMLGVDAALGRTLTRDDDKPGAHVVVLSNAFWRKQFGAAADVTGKTLTLDSSAYTIAGVLPAGFRYLGEPLAGTATEIDVWLSLAANPLINSQRSLRFLKLIGERKPNLSTAQASDDVARMGQTLAQQFPDSNAGFAMSAWPLAERINGSSRTTLVLLLGAVAFVLLMVCSNVAHLLLARAVAREQDLTVRIALGASRFRLIRQMLAEGSVLAFLGTGVGIALSIAILKILIAIGPAALLQTRPIQIDWRALAFTMAIGIASAVFSGLPPAWKVVREEIGVNLRREGRSLTAGHHRLRAALVVVQVAVALVLLSGAGLLIHSFIRLLDVNPGFDARRVLAVSTQMPATANAPAKRAAIYQSVRNEIRTLPGIIDVAAVSRLPLLGSNLGSWVYKEGARAGEHPPDVEFRTATPNYFSTMGIPLKRGRVFDDHDAANPVVVIDETAATRFWPGEDPVGKRIKLGSNAPTQPWFTIVGVVGRVRHGGLAVDPPPHVYRSYNASPLLAPILLIRTSGNPAQWINTVTAKIHALNQDLPTFNIYPMQELVERSTAQRRFVMLLLAAFGAIAMLLAVVGIYGTVSQSVAQRTREIGLRMALGASPGAALKLVMGEGFRLIGTGILAGSIAALALTRFMQSMLFDLRALDPVSFVAAAAILAAAALLACYGPASRATRVDPAVALRH